MHIRLKVETPMGLLAYLRAHCPSYSSVKALKRAIDQKQCKINGSVERFSTHPLKRGDVIELKIEEAPQTLKSPVLYEDETLIAFNKSPHTLSDAPLGLYPVHRLDKETSGVLIFAKNVKSQEMLSTFFAEREVEKHYLALVDDKVEMSQWTCDNFLGKKQSYEGGAIYGAVLPKLGRRALTHFKCLKTAEKASLILCKPVTGRTHQIRAHLKIAGHPVLGDWQYARHFKCPYEPKRHLLHAYSLQLPNVHIVAPLLEDFITAYVTVFEDPDCQDLRDWRRSTDFSSTH